MGITPKNASFNTKKFIQKILSNPLLASLPIKIEEVVKLEGLKLVPYSFDDDISGVLVIDNGTGVIGFNQNESKVRRRFTIAHELGHYILHKDKGSKFLDKALFRHNNSSYPEDFKTLEREANQFAANILMPEKLVRAEIEKFEYDFHEEVSIKELAKKFEVSAVAMTYRLINLGIMEDPSAI